MLSDQTADVHRRPLFQQEACRGLVNMSLDKGGDYPTAWKHRSFLRPGK
jgi:hypothetical protein